MRNQPHDRFGNTRSWCCAVVVPSGPGSMLGLNSVASSGTTLILSAEVSNDHVPLGDAAAVLSICTANLRPRTWTHALVRLAAERSPLLELPPTTVSNVIGM